MERVFGTLFLVSATVFVTVTFCMKYEEKVAVEPPPYAGQVICPAGVEGFEGMHGEIYHIPGGKYLVRCDHR